LFSPGPLTTSETVKRAMLHDPGLLSDWYKIPVRPQALAPLLIAWLDRWQPGFINGRRGG